MVAFMVNLQKKLYFGLILLSLFTTHKIFAEENPDSLVSEQAAFFDDQEESLSNQQSQTDPKLSSTQNSDTKNAESLGANLSSSSSENESDSSKQLVSTQSIKKTIKKITTENTDQNTEENTNGLLEKQKALLNEIQKLQNDNNYLQKRKSDLENDPHNKLVEGTILSINDFAVVLTVSSVAFIAICAAIGWKIRDLNMRANIDQKMQVADRALPQISEQIDKLLEFATENETDTDSVKKMAALIDNYQKSRKKLGKSDNDNKFVTLDTLNRGLTEIITKEIEAEKSYLGADSSFFGSKNSSKQLNVLNEMLTEVKKFKTPLGHSASELELVKHVTNVSKKTKTAKKAFKERQALANSEGEGDDDEELVPSRTRRLANSSFRSRSSFSDHLDTEDDGLTRRSKQTRRLR